MATPKNSLRDRDFSRRLDDDDNLPPPHYDETDPADEIPDDMGAFLANMGSCDGEIKVYRMKQGTQRGMAYLFSFKPGDYSYDGMLTFLRDEYEGGDFCIKVHGGVSNQLLKTERVSVEAPRTKGALLAPANPQTDIIAMMREQAAQNQAMMMQLMTAVAGRPVPESQSLGLVEIITLMDKFNKPAPNPLEQLQLMRELTDFGRELSGNAPPEDTGFMGMLKTLAPALAAVAGQNAQSERPPTPQRLPQQRPPIAPQPRQPAPQIAPSEPRPPADAVESEAEFRVLIKMLIRAASVGAEPAQYADVVIDQLGEENCIALTGNAELLQGLLAQFPDAQPHVDWFTTLRDEISAALTPGDDVFINADDTEGGAND